MSNNPAVVIGITATDTAKQVLQQVDQKVAETATKIDSAGEKIITKTSAMASSFKKHAGDILTSAAGLGAGITGLVLNYGDLEDMQVRVEAANVTYQRSLQTLDKLQQSGKASAVQLALAQQDVKAKADNLAKAQGDVSDAYTQFLANVPSQMISFGTAASSIYNMIGKSSINSAKTATASAVEYVGAMQAETVATDETAASTTALGTAMKAVFLSNPVTLPLVALGALLTAVAFNVGGLRDRFNDLGKMLGDLLPFLRPLLDALGYLGNLLGSFTGTGVTAKTQDYATATNVATVAVADMKDKVSTLNDYLDDQNSKLADTYHNNLLYVESTGAIKDALSLSNDELNRAAEYLRKQQSETESATQDNFNLVASVKGIETALSLGDAQLNKMAQSIRIQQNAQDSLKSSTDAVSAAYVNMKAQVDTVKTALEQLAEAQQRTVVTQFGQQMGLSGTVSVDALNAAGLGGNAGLAQSAANGRLGGVFVAGQGRVLDTGGQLYENVLGVGTETGTPHLLHKNEFIVPPSKLGRSSGSSNGNTPATIIFEVNGEAIARATVDDITRLQGKTTRLQAKTYRQRRVG